MERIQVIDAGGPEIPGLAETGSAYYGEGEFKVPELPEGDWHLRALTEQGLEIPAASLHLDVKTRVVSATFSNPFNVDVKIIGYAIDVV